MIIAIGHTFERPEVRSLNASCSRTRGRGKKCLLAQKSQGRRISEYLQSQSIAPSKKLELVELMTLFWRNDEIEARTTYG